MELKKGNSDWTVHYAILWEDKFTPSVPSETLKICKEISRILDSATVLVFCSQMSAIVISIKKSKALFAPCSRKNQSDLYQSIFNSWTDSLYYVIFNNLLTSLAFAMEIWLFTCWYSWQGCCDVVTYHVHVRRHFRMFWFVNPSPLTFHFQMLCLYMYFLVLTLQQKHLVELNLENFCFKR